MEVFRRIFGWKSSRSATELPGKWIRKQLEEYVTNTLAEAVPADWEVKRHDPQRLWWVIQRISIPPGEWAPQDYSLLVSEDLQWFIFTHGNNDVGFGLHYALLNALVISTSSLELPSPIGSNSVGLHRFHLRECIRFALEHCRPNEWGYT